MFLAMAALGLPGLGNFVAEFLILLGTFQVAKWAAVLGAVGLIFATVYALWLVQRAFQGKETHAWTFEDLVPRETAVFAVMIAALVVLGFYPQPLIATARKTVASVQQITAASGAVAGGAGGGSAAAPLTDRAATAAGHADAQSQTGSAQR